MFSSLSPQFLNVVYIHLSFILSTQQTYYSAQENSHQATFMLCQGFFSPIILNHSTIPASNGVRYLGSPRQLSYLNNWNVKDVNRKYKIHFYLLDTRSKHSLSHKLQIYHIILKSFWDYSKWFYNTIQLPPLTIKNLKKFSQDSFLSCNHHPSKPQNTLHKRLCHISPSPFPQ